MSAAGLLAPAPAPAPTGTPPAPEYYPEEDEELESAEDDERSCRGRESDEGASLRAPGTGWDCVGRDGASGRGAARPRARGSRQDRGAGELPHLFGARDSLGTLCPTVAGRRDLGDRLSQLESL